VEHPEATGADEAKARQAYREFAAGQNRLWHHYRDGKIRAIAGVMDEVQRHLVKSFGRAVGCPLGNLAVELATTEDTAGKHVAGVFARLEERVAGHCWDAAEVGQLAEGVDPDELAHLVIATMDGMILLVKVSDADVGPVPVAIHHAIDFCLAKASGA
jgi:TetR/AcrR family transcriptional repressor of nem operon